MRERALTVNDLPGPHRLFAATLHDLPQLRILRLATALKQQCGSLHVIADRSQGLVDLMRYCCRHLSHIGKAGDMYELGRQLLHPVLGFLPLS